MFEALAQRLLNSILGEYIENFSAENLKIGIWSGEVVLKNVVLKKSIIKKLNLPFKIKYSRLGCLKMTIPWKNLTTSKIEVLLEGFELIIAEVPTSEWVCKNTKIIEKRKKEIESFCDAVINDFSKKNEKGKENEEGYFSKLVVKIIDNLQVTIKDIHIRYEDEITKAYSFGVTLEEFKLYTVNSKGEPQYVDRNKPQFANQPLRKKLQLYNIGIYWNERSEFYSETNCPIKMGSTIAKRGQTSFQHNYVILMSSQAQLLQREPGKQFFEPEISLKIDLKTLRIEITNIQLQQIISLAERLQRYSKKVKEENRVKLSDKQIQANRQYFQRIFPDYYNGLGSNLSKNDMQKLENILEKMQVDNFTKDINQFLQDKEKQRIIKQKQEKKKSWWYGKPKQLTKQELKQIENYLNDNFGQEVAVVKRPQDYHYIRIVFKLERLEVVIANRLAIMKEGIQAQFEDLQLKFSLRDGGYSIQLALQDIAINMFKQIGVDPRETKQVLYKLLQANSKLDHSYLKLIVIGNPLDKKHLNTDIKMTTSELMIVFDPKIITIATEFVDLNLSQENKEAAIEKFGEIKEKTEAAVTETIDKPVKAQIGADIVFNSITVAIPFSPQRQNSDCWGLNLGVTHLTTDQETLKRLQSKQNQPLDVFNLQLTSFSFRHFSSVNQLKESLTNQSNLKITHSVIDNLNFNLRVEVFDRATQTQSKIRIITVLPSLSINLNQFTYTNILKLGDSFAQQEKIQHLRVTARIDEKKQIQQRASKIGFVHIKDSITKIWKKYIAIMSENYIYIFLNKNDKDYYAYYYIKGAILEKYREPLDKQKPYHFKIKNKVNEVVFGFDKEQQIDDWIDKIQALSKQSEFVSQIANVTAVNALAGLFSLVPEKKHNQLNLFINAEIQSIGIKVYTTQSLLDKVVKLYFTKLSSQISIYESKKNINLQLVSLELLDTIQRYQNKGLIYFLQTKRKTQNESLINLEIEQLNKDHPLYDRTDSTIQVSFGTLQCNYKCETVKLLMDFFIPPPSSDDKKPPSAILESDISGTLNTSLEIQNLEETFSLKLTLKIEEISVTLVNEKIKTIIGKMGITNLDLYTGISQKRMLLKGSLKDLYYIDTTNYPNTIYKQQEQYPNQRFILTANIGQNKNMLDFDIQILNELNEYKKKMLIDIKLANLTTFYVQQPVLRLITYLNTQMLPSFKTKPKEDEAIPANDTKPEPTTMQLKVQLTNISVFVQTQYFPTQKQKQQFMQLNISKIQVSNDTMYRDFVKGQQKKPIILVENYLVKLFAMSISVHYFDMNNSQHRYKLTNNLDLTVSTDLIANPEYYKKIIPEVFQNGLRVQCFMTAFFMRLNHDDYSFIMKCLNWGITHDDGLQKQLFDIPVNPSQIKSKETEPAKDPFYLVVKMDCISLFVTQNNIPISFLLLDKMVYHFVSNDLGMQMDLIMKTLYGTSIQFNEKERILTERGIFNSLGYTSKHKLEKNIDLQGFIALFGQRNQVSQLQKPDFMKCIITMTDRSMDIQLDMNELYIDIDVRLLMILSTLANTDEKYIKGPQPIIEKEEIRLSEIVREQNRKSNPKKFSLLLKMNKMVGSVSDETKQKFAIIQSAVLFTMLNYGDKQIEEIAQCIRRKPVNDGINHSSMTATLKNFTVYFSKIKDGKILAKREFLKPMVIDFDQQRFYTRQNDIYILATEIRLKTDELLLSATVKDVLNINKILQDNLKVLDSFKSESDKVKQVAEKQDLHEQLQKIEQNIAREIQSKTKIVGTIAPIQLEIINDCDSNFMPVLRLLIQDTKPAMYQTIISTELFIVPIISLYFFNPRSSRWQPIIEPFKASINYKAITIKKEQSVNINIKTASLQEQTSSLKINVSTQMISTIMATKDIVLAEKQNIDKNIQTKEIQISPFIFHNVTNQKIFLLRGESEFQLSPLFKGPIRLIKTTQIIFRLNNKTHKFSLDHYGVLKIPQSDYFIRFASQKLNRVIKFLPKLVIKNKIQQPIYIKRFGNVPEVPKKVEINDSIPLDNVQSFAVSLNGNSYTQKIQLNAIKFTGFLLAEKKNFLVLLKYRQKINRCTFVNLIPPFIIYNCLPKELNIQFIQKAKTKSTVTIKTQHSYSVFANEDIPTIQMKAYVHGYTWTSKFKYDIKNEDECHLILEDEDSFKTILNYVFKRDSKTNQYILIIYCKKIIVNELHDKLLVYANFSADEKSKKNDKFELLGGQKKDEDSFDDKIIMVGEEVGNKLRVCGTRSIFDFATPISIGGLGSSHSRIVVDREYQGRNQTLFTVIGVEITAIKMTKECDIFCKKIVLRSKSIIVNNTKYDLTIMEDIATKYKFAVEAGQKKNFVFGLPEVSGKHYKYVISTKGYSPSKLINLPTQGAVFFKLTNEKLDKEGKKVATYFKIYVQQVDYYNFYEISEITSEDLPYEVLVKSSNLEVTVDSLNLTAKKGETRRFINQIEDQEKHFIDLIITHRESKQELKMRVCPDDLKFKEKDLIRIERGGMVGSVAIVVEVTLRDKQKVIAVDELMRVQEAKEIQQSLMVVDLAQIIVSINQNSQSIEFPYESFVLTLRRLCFIKLETDMKMQYQFKLGFLQIDQAYPHIISTPVIFTPHKYELFTKEKDPSSIFNFTIVFSKEFVKNTFINEIAIDFDDIVATFSADFINIATEIATEFGEVINYKQNTYLIDKKQERWQNLKLPPETNNVFIKAIKISPFVIELSAELTKKLNLQNNLLLSTIMATVGIVMTNIQNAPFEMTGIEINDCIDTVDSITNKLVTHYKRTCINQLYKVFGSLNIIGNPMSLFRNISTGVKDLTEKPARGFVNGPAQFGLGIVEGTGSFFAHSVGGAFGSVAKVTGTFSTGLATLAFDKEFQEHREKEKMKKPQNVIQGLEKGGKAIFYGFKQGITGIWTQPIQNARREGALGFIKGTAKGLAGLVIKPVTGIIDFASKTTQGIKNNALMFQDKPNEKRMRFPRVFYTECFILKEYSQRDSQLFSIFKKMENQQKFQNSIFIDAFQTVNGKEFLIILQTGIAELDISSRKVKWAIDFADLELVDNKERKMLLFKKRGKAANFFNVDYDVAIQEDDLRALVADLILTLQKERQNF